MSFEEILNTVKNSLFFPCLILPLQIQQTSYKYALVEYERQEDAMVAWAMLWGETGFSPKTGERLFVHPVLSKLQQQRVAYFNKEWHTVALRYIRRRAELNEVSAVCIECNKRFTEKS